jgi:integrase
MRANVATNISTVKAREALKPQHEPYFLKLARGQYLGFQKLTATSTGGWIARSRDDESGKQRKRSLGDFAHLSPSERFDAARSAADEWFRHLGQGGSAEAVTVRKACENYVAHVRADRGDAPADDMDMRFKRWVYPDKALGGVELAKLTKARVENWRKAMAKKPVQVNRDDREVPITRPRAASSVNRDIAALRAALNYAHDGGHVVTDLAWRVALRPTKNADGRRDVYLDRAQRRKLIRVAAPDVAKFLRGLALVPLRPGALAALKVGDFDKRLATLNIGKDKAGRDRKIKVPALTAEMFTAEAKDKLPAAPLLARTDGKAWTKDAWKWPIKAAALEAGLPPATTAYALRHSVITDLVTGGLDLLTVAQLSGTSVAMIERHYGHLRADHAAAALARLAL